MFGERLALAERYVAHLSSSGVERGLLGPREVPRLWDRHVLNCAVVTELIPAGAGVLDLGSGAGLPGVTLALARPDLRVVLVEPLQRRSDWLLGVVDDLCLDSVQVVRARAEQLDGARAQVVTARAVAALGLLAGWALPLLEPHGELLAIKGRTAGEELAAAAGTLAGLGAVRTSIDSCGTGLLHTPTTVVRVRVGARPPAGRPRRRSTAAGRAQPRRRE